MEVLADQADPPAPRRASALRGRCHVRLMPRALQGEPPAILGLGFRAVTAASAPGPVRPGTGPEGLPVPPRRATNLRNAHQ